MGVGPGRKISPDTGLILSGCWQPVLRLERPRPLCGFAVPASLRPADPGMGTLRYLQDPLALPWRMRPVRGLWQQAKITGPKSAGLAWVVVCGYCQGETFVMGESCLQGPIMVQTCSLRLWSWQVERAKVGGSESPWFKPWDDAARLCESVRVTSALYAFICKSMP